MGKNEETKTWIQKTEQMLKDLGNRGSEIAKSLKKDAQYGTKYGMIKVEQLTLENEKNKLMTQFGKEAYVLMRRKEITHKDLKEPYEKIQDIENRIRGKKVSMANIKKKRGG